MVIIVIVNVNVIAIVIITFSQPMVKSSVEGSIVSIIITIIPLIVITLSKGNQWSRAV